MCVCIDMERYLEKTRGSKRFDCAYCIAICQHDGEYTPTIYITTGIFSSSYILKSFFSILGQHKYKDIKHKNSCLPCMTGHNKPLS